MKKITGLFLAAATMTSLVGCRVTETTRTRIPNVPYSTTRTVRRQAPSTNQTRIDIDMPRAALPRVGTNAPGTNRAPFGKTYALPGARRSMQDAMPYINSGVLPNNMQNVNRGPSLNVVS